MNPTAVALAENIRQELVTILNATLASTLDLQTKVKQAHWNVKGAQFFARHELFDQLADHLRERADTVAERASTLGGTTTGTLRMAVKETKLPEYDVKGKTGKDHVEALVRQYGKYCGMLRENVAESGKRDPATEDLMTETLREAELDLWFLESHLQG